MSEFEQDVTCSLTFSDRPGYRMPKFVDVQVIDGTLYVWLGLRTWAASVSWPNSTRRTITADKILSSGVRPQEVKQ